MFILPYFNIFGSLFIRSPASDKRGVSVIQVRNGVISFRGRKLFSVF